MAEIAPGKRLCVIYRSPRREEMYLYVDQQDGLKRVPEALLEQFGPPQEALRLVLHRDRRLARADIDKVLAALEEPGYYLQMPPARDEDQP